MTVKTMTRRRRKRTVGDVLRARDRIDEAKHAYAKVMAEAFDDGVSAVTIAEALGVHRARVYQLIDEARAREEAEKKAQTNGH
jgi:DNA-binding transcriptional regulator LsrR (DeoR family)